MIARPQQIAHFVAPVLMTERLCLRMPRYEDFAHRLAFYADERSV